MSQQTGLPTLLLLPHFLRSLWAPVPSRGLTGRHRLLPAALELVFLLGGVPAFKEALPMGKW